MSDTQAEHISLSPSALGTSLSVVRLCEPSVVQHMRSSLATIGQLTAVQAYRVGERFEIFDGFKRAHAARELSWPTIQVDLHTLDDVGAKARLLRCNESIGLSDLEEAWVVRSLYRDDKLSQPQIAQMLARHKSWVCRRLSLAEGISDEMTANVRLGLISATVVRELARLPRGNQDVVARIVAKHGLTTRQTARLVNTLIETPEQEWPILLEQAAQRRASKKPANSRKLQRTPSEQLCVDAWAIERIAVRLQTQLLQRSLISYGAQTCAMLCRELGDLRSTLNALTQTITKRLDAPGKNDVVI
jgi:ParB-like chromosome segregation protein Spo0J